jgi:outer membrane receptor protein involved in Fe transport
MPSVTVDVVGAPLESVLRTIASKAGLRIAVDKGMIDPTRGITLRIRNVSVSDAFAQALAGTGLRAMLVGDIAVLVSENGVNANGGITGRVIDAAARQPLRGVMVTLDGATKGIMTGETGTFLFREVSNGSHTIVVKRIGYHKITRPVSVTDGAAASVEIVLEQSVSTLDQVVVTGTVIPTERKALPNAITVITAKQLEERGIHRIDQLFRGDVPGLFTVNQGSAALLDEVRMFSRGATALSRTSAGTTNSDGDAFYTNPIKTYVDGVELADSKYLSQIDPKSIERIEILSGPQASTIYGSNAINGVMQIFTKRGAVGKPRLTMSMMGGTTENNLSAAVAPNYTTDMGVSGIEGRLSYNIGGSADYTGSWTPAKNSIRYSVFGGGRIGMGKFVSDLTVRQGITQNRQGGDSDQLGVLWAETGLQLPNFQMGNRQYRMLSVLRGQTAGVTFSYTPWSAWSHELVLGSDASDVDATQGMPSYGSQLDTLRRFSQTNNRKISERYATTVRAPLFHDGELVVTTGVDHWRARSSLISAQSLALTGTLGTPSVTRNPPEKNTGGFVQGQFALYDMLFLTYGLRAEWNPNYGDDVQPNLAPRYGVAYVRDVYGMTAKVRATYGRATRPPTTDAKLLGGINTNPTRLIEYGAYYNRLANPELGPESQQGGEGGIELYFGSKGSLVITRYNQTVNELIGSVFRVDSVRSLIPNPTQTNTPLDADLHGYQYQSQNLNVGSIRNQGWELQGSWNSGPFTTRATYSWTKSRVIGITPRYRAFLTGSEYQVGRSFSGLPEHTWAVTTAYARATTDVAFTINGNGQIYMNAAENNFRGDGNWRLNDYRYRMSLPSGYRHIGGGYLMADLNATHRWSSNIEGVLQIQNLADFYRQDVSLKYPSIGRQTRVGFRIRLN